MKLASEPSTKRTHQLALRVDDQDKARITAIIDSGDAANTTEAIRFALQTTERVRQERDLVAQFAEASREWEASGDGDAWDRTSGDRL
jgi:Arc/MetJ-type ribon-helix-helix transcriptional regulator